MAGDQPARGIGSSLHFAAMPDSERAMDDWRVAVPGLGCCERRSGEHTSPAGAGGSPQIETGLLPLY